MRKILKPVLLILFISSLAVHPYKAVGKVVEKGKITKKVICLNEPSQSYALYLPLEYTPEKKWPILYALDPGARGILPLKQYKEAAEKYNYIVAGSNNAQNGPWEPIIRSIIAIWNDTNARLSINQKRIYVTGFSGGSRAASLFSKIIKRPVAGIIGCGAGLATVLKPEEIAPAFYFGVVGIEDFNYEEMLTLDKQFDKHNISHRFFVFKGPHAWPPQDVCMRVVEWMEILGVSKKIRPTEDELIKEIYEKELTKAETFEASGQLLQAVSDYEAIALTFKEWQATDAVETKIEHIKQNKEYRRLVKKEKKRRDKELFQKSRFRRILTQIENDESAYRNLNKILSDLGLNSLLREAGKKKDLNDSALDIRILHRLEMDSSGKGWDHLQKNDHKGAILFFEIAARAGIKSHRRLYSYYALACAYSLSKNSKQALKNLKLAVENGFKDIDSLEQDERLKFIRKTPEFQKILETLEKKNCLIGDNHIISRMTFYKYFKNKIDLALFILNKLYLDGIDRSKGIMAQNIPYSEKVKVMTQMKLEITRDISREMLKGWLQDWAPEVAELMQRIRRENIKLFLDDMVTAQNKGEIRKNINSEFILCFLNKMREIGGDEQLINIYDSTQSLTAELTNFFFFGILTKNMEDK
jgi:hypothetical protein